MSDSMSDNRFKDPDGPTESGLIPNLHRLDLPPFEGVDESHPEKVEDKYINPVDSEDKIDLDSIFDKKNIYLYGDRHTINIYM